MTEGGIIKGLEKGDALLQVWFPPIGEAKAILQ